MCVISYNGWWTKRSSLRLVNILITQRLALIQWCSQLLEPAWLLHCRALLSSKHLDDSMEPLPKWSSDVKPTLFWNPFFDKEVEYWANKFSKTANGKLISFQLKKNIYYPYELISIQKFAKFNKTLNLCRNGAIKWYEVDLKNLMSGLCMQTLAKTTSKWCIYSKFSTLS